MYKAVDFIQWVWKKAYNVDHSKTKIRQDLKQGAINSTIEKSKKQI